MGNSPHPSHKLFQSLSISKIKDAEQRVNPFIVKQILTQSQKHHQQMLSQITKLKQYQCENVVKVIDAHTIQTHNLCAIISHIYVLMQKPTYTLKQYAEKLIHQGLWFQNEEVVALLLGFARAIQYLQKQGQEYLAIDETIVYINDNGSRQISVKLMNPFFTDFNIEKERLYTIQQQIALLILSLKPLIAQDLANLVFLMRDGKISLRAVAEGLSHNLKKSNNGLQLVKNINNQLKPGRESINSLASNAESLMINGGDESQLMFKDFYEHFNNSISDISTTNLDGFTLNEASTGQQTPHKFPKKYLKSKALKKVSNRDRGSESWSEKGSEKHKITRDQSLKDNFRIQSKPVLLSSAKLVESFISELYNQ